MADREPAPIAALEDVSSVLARVKSKAGRVVLTNGCFDWVHHGHIDFLRSCADLGDVLVVGVNEDGSVRLLKGASRPIFPVLERARMLAAIRWVDLVVTFPQETADILIEVVGPHVYAKGADYDPAAGGDPLPELDAVTTAGCALRYIPLTPGVSSSDLIRGLSPSGDREPSH